MASPSDLNLEYKPDINQMIQKPVGEHPDSQKRIKEFLARLEEERLKIEAFKRELPLCMQLLNNAMETYAQQLEEYQSSQGPKPVLEEFIPLRQTSIEGSSDAAASEKASWMVSAQLALWSQTPKDCEPKLALDSKQRNGGAFLPFSKEKNQCAASTASGGLPELALASSEKDSREKSNIESGSKGGEVGGGKGGGSKSEGQAANQTQRKARRCWSPDLHRRFVDALQMLGGSQVATPKQIRELMKVDGLTNDEVKSHLQVLSSLSLSLSLSLSRITKIAKMVYNSQMYTKLPLCSSFLLFFCWPEISAPHEASNLGTAADGHGGRPATSCGARRHLGTTGVRHVSVRRRRSGHLRGSPLWPPPPLLPGPPSERVTQGQDWVAGVRDEERRGAVGDRRGGGGRRERGRGRGESGREGKGGDG
ncbi:myb family transcription factor EFM-like isoform X2 [Typha latifolia]|uniref:myb family transcription factor EFM-like isoform X2 n=1 Tax=Typha latifolia TaxID=4733 RepID=UPI003C2E1D9E